jgi:hypothetical protein
MRLQTEIIKKRFMLFGFVVTNMAMFFLSQHLTQKLLYRLQLENFKQGTPFRVLPSQHYDRKDSYS